MLRFTSLARTVAVVPLRVRRDQVFGIGRKATFQLGQQWTSFSTKAKNSNHLSNTTFDSLDISDLTKAAITQELKYEYLTHVQNETLQVIMEGKDVLTKAKTGNGKTMAFLLPMIEHLIRDGRQAGTIPALIISPTRELAHQIATEARRLTKFHRMNIACFVGGSPINRDSKALTSGAPLDILIATPGRLIDHLGQNTGNLTRKVKNLRTLVLDEADRLLDMGFRQELLKIIKHLPKERQTLLFSATLPASTEELKKVALKDDYAFVDTIDEADHQTNVQTTQHFVVCPMDKVISTVEQVLTKHMIQHPTDYKIMVFSPTARAAQFMAHLFQAAGFDEVLEMHSRKSQSARIKTSDVFRKGTNVIMFTSDVSARGVDYPDVTLVVQVGLTDRDQYIHRLGRTARAGSHGEGILVLADFEKTLLNDLSDLPLLEKDLSTDKALGRSRTEKVMSALREGSDLHKSAEQSYQAWLGFYNSHLKRLRMTKEELVEMAHSYSSMIGLREPPKLDGRTLKKMGLFGVQGLEPGQFIERRRGQNHGGSSQSRDDAGERPYGRYRGSKSDNRREEASSRGRHGHEERSPRSASGRGFGRFKEEGHSQDDRNADSNNARSHSRGRSRYGRRDSNRDRL